MSKNVSNAGTLDIKPQIAKEWIEAECAVSVAKKATHQ
jgi:hypothetical protein